PTSELNMIRWLERESYDVTYATDMDLDASPTLLHGRRLLIVGGHDEYWSTAMRDHATTALDAGVSLAFFSANNMYWHIRLQPSPLGDNREVICYKVAQKDPLYSEQPLETTTRWRDPPLSNPESNVLGQMYQGIAEEDTVAPLVLTPGAQPFFAGTNLALGISLPGLVGGEFDQVTPSELEARHIIVLANSRLICRPDLKCSPNGTALANATVYRMPNGAGVFDAGTFYWSWGLDNERFDQRVPAHTASSPGFQRFTANILAYLLARK
ncbi:MAG TPA: N,N-dimethylformamidase beta subunit family domain-containing protein, partial [Ktedonobacterales bacterium]|nr:N,N-dimethylformamidase beta subunit family domain-containing protein [Ktedonobacterales bacterium]